MNNKMSPQMMAAFHANAPAMKGQMWRLGVNRVLNGRVSFWSQLLIVPTILSGLVFRPTTGWGRVLTWLFWFWAIVVMRTIYNLVLYPAFLTPLYNIPTPKDRSVIWGNFLPWGLEPTLPTAKRLAKEVSNSGLIRYYSPLAQEKLLVTSPKAIGEIMVQQSYKFGKPAFVRAAIVPVAGEGLGLAEGNVHRAQRKAIMPAFSYRHIKNLYPILWRRATEMVSAIEKEMKTSPTIVTRDWASRCALDIVGEAGMGYNFGALKNPKDDKLLKAYRELFSPPTQNMLFFVQFGFYFMEPEWLLRLPVEVNRKRAEHTTFVRNTVKEVIRNKKGNEADGSVDIISLAISDKSGIFKEKDLVNLMMNMLAAGHETSASAMQFLVWVLGRNPIIQARLREEVRSKLPAITVDDLSMDMEDPKPWDTELVDSLPYLNAVVMEVLRMYPPAPTVGRKALEDVVVMGTLVPKGTDITFAAPLINTNPELWGPDAHLFNPERWMGLHKSANGGAKSPYAFMTFIQGPRTCIGNQFSKSELLVMAAAFVGRFKFEGLHPEKELEVDLSVTMSPKDGAEVRIEIVEGW